MTRLVLFMARRRTTWLLWMSLGIPFVLMGMLVDFGLESYRAVRHSWKWHWQPDLAEFFANFGEQHRKSLRTLGLRPEPGGKLMRR